MPSREGQSRDKVPLVALKRVLTPHPFRIYVLGWKVSDVTFDGESEADVFNKGAHSPATMDVVAAALLGGGTRPLVASPSSGAEVRRGASEV